MARQRLLFDDPGAAVARSSTRRPRRAAGASQRPPAASQPRHADVPEPERLDFVALDFETADAAHRYPIALGLVRIKRGRVAEEAYHLIQAPARVFNPSNTAVHGIQPREVAEAEAFAAVWQAVQPLLEGAEFLAAHYAPFDRGVLAAVCRRFKLSPPGLPWTCTRQLAKQTWGLARGGLAHVAAHLGIALNHHQALSDAQACAQIVLRASQARHAAQA